MGRHIMETDKKQENLAKFLASNKMFSTPATTQCEIINLFLLNQLAKSLPELGLDWTGWAGPRRRRRAGRSRQAWQVVQPIPSNAKNLPSHCQSATHIVGHLQMSCRRRRGRWRARPNEAMKLFGQPIGIMAKN